MAQNDFKPFAIGSGANVTSQADWEALSALVTGFQSGKASSAQVNKAIRQASFISAALAQFVSDKNGADVLDDGDLPGFVTDFISAVAVQSLTRANPFADIKADGTVNTALSNLGLGNLKYGSPLIGQLIEWPLQKMPQEIWTDCGMEFIPYMAQSFDPVKYPLLSQLHPTNVLPADMRGYIPRGWDNGRGIDTGRVLMSAQEDAIRNITGTVSGGTDPSQQFLGDAVTATGAFSVTNIGSKYGIGADPGSGGCQSLVLDVSKVVQTAAENRMRNVAWNMIVRAK